MTEQMSTLPENVGAVVHPANKNYIMFTTFKADGLVNEDLLNSGHYIEAMKKVITRLDTSYFEYIRENSNLKGKRMPFIVPQTIKYLNELPTLFTEMVSKNCETWEKDGDEDTAVIMRFFEFDEEEGTYSPVHVDIQNRQIVSEKPAYSTEK